MRGFSSVENDELVKDIHDFSHRLASLVWDCALKSDPFYEHFNITLFYFDKSLWLVFNPPQTF